MKQTGDKRNINRTNKIQDSMRSLQDVLILSGVPRWHQSAIFGKAQLVGNDLLVPDPDIASMITRCYLPEFAKLGVTWRVIVAKPQPVAPQPGQAFKKAVYTGKLKLPTQADML